MIKPSFISDVDWKCLEKRYNEKRLIKVVDKIKKNYPIQYAIGNVEFLDSKIIVNKNVLIPRFETELLVDKLKKIIIEKKLQNATILDLCTGSGCIGISLKKTFPNSNVIAVDKSIKALLIAKKNAKINITKIKFYKKDILKTWNINKKASIIVANPPYVKLNEVVTPNTIFEPKMALYPGVDDIIFYKKILDKVKDIAYPTNIIVFEIGSTQSERICKYASSIFKNCKIVVEKDYNNLDRFIFIYNNFE